MEQAIRKAWPLSPPTVSIQSFPLAEFNKKPTGKGAQELEITGVSIQDGHSVGQKRVDGFSKLCIISTLVQDRAARVSK